MLAPEVVEPALKSHLAVVVVALTDRARERLDAGVTEGPDYVFNLADRDRSAREFRAVPVPGRIIHRRTGSA